MGHAKHGASFTIIERHADGTNTWQAKCGRHATWTGPCYESVEDQWRQHVHAETGAAPTPMGDKNGRWTP